MLVLGATSNVCAVTYRAQGLPAQDALKTVNLKAVRFGARISSECAQVIKRQTANKKIRKERTDSKNRLKKARIESPNCSIASDSNEGDGYSTLLSRSIIPHENQNVTYQKASNAEKHKSLRGHIPFSQYSFLQLSPSAGLGTEDMDYLASKRCFQVPAQPALDGLVRMYFMHVHPYSPVLDEASFWRAYRRGPSSDDRPVSLFVFQALLFVCCTVSYTGY